MQTTDQALMHLSMSLAQVSRAYRSVADKVIGDYGLSQATAWPLLMIGRLGEGVRPGAVADSLGLEPSSLVRVLDQLVEAGLRYRKFCQQFESMRTHQLHVLAVRIADAAVQPAVQRRPALHVRIIEHHYTRQPEAGSDVRYPGVVAYQ